MESFAQNSVLDPQAVSAKAYEIWESMGRPEGAAERTWLEAERILRQSHGEPSVASSPTQPLTTPLGQVAATTEAKTPAARATAATVEATTARAEPEPLAANVAPAKRKSDPPSAPNSNVQQKKPTGGTKRGSRR